MKGIIIINGFYKPQSLQYQLNKFSEVFKNRNIEFAVFDTQQFKIIIDKDKFVTDLPKCDFIIYLDKDKHIARMLEKAGFKLFNSAEALELSDDKMFTYIQLSNKGIKMPITYSSPLMYKNDLNLSDNTVDAVERLFTYPLIVKESHGSLGKQVYLIENIDELVAIREKLKYIPHVYQQFIAESRGMDIRIIVIGGKITSAIMRKNDKDFRSNVELGATAYKYSPEKSFIEVAESASKILGLDYCGIDLLIDKDDKPILCEVNANAYFTASEKISGVDIAGAYIDHIINSLK